MKLICNHIPTSRLLVTLTSRPLLILTSLLLLAAVPVTSEEPAGTTTPTSFDQVLEHYESVRVALTHDTTRGVAARGRSIATVLDRLSTDWSPERAGVEAEQSEAVRALLPALRAAANALAAASSLDDARDAFYALSKPLVRWRKAAIGGRDEGDRPTVAYCSMARRSWLQPEGELGNPYYGQAMLRCGETVDS